LGLFGGEVTFPFAAPELSMPFGVDGLGVPASLVAPELPAPSGLAVVGAEFPFAAPELSTPFGLAGVGLELLFIDPELSMPFGAIGGTAPAPSDAAGLSTPLDAGGLASALGVEDGFAAPSLGSGAAATADPLLSVVAPEFAAPCEFASALGVPSVVEPLGPV
jgi:hypothetical protein